MSADRTVYEVTTIDGIRVSTHGKRERAMAVIESMAQEGRRGRVFAHRVTPNFHIASTREI